MRGRMLRGGIFRATLPSWRKARMGGAGLLVYGAILLALLGATPAQGIPPSPAIYTGTATVDGQPAPEGTVLVACVDNLVCGPDNPTHRASADTVGAGGKFFALTAQGTDRIQRGRATVHFFMINQHGRVKAEETTTYGTTSDTDLIFTQNLTFGAAPTPVPTPTPEVVTPTTAPPTPIPPTETPTPPPTPTTPPPPPTALPIPGEPLLPQLAQSILYGGIALLVLGTAALLYARRHLNN